MFLTIAVRVTSKRENYLSIAVKQLAKVDAINATLMGEARKLVEIIPLTPKLGVEPSQVFADNNLSAKTHFEDKLSPRRLAGAHELFGERVLFFLGEADGYGFCLASCQWHSSFD